MSNSAFQLQFAAELVAMLVAAAGVVLVVLRADLTGSARWARAALAVGFVAVGVAAFIHGSFLSSSSSETSRRGIGALRLVGDGALAAGCLRWRAGWGVRLALWLGVLVGGAAAVVDLANGSLTLAAVLLVIGSSGVAVALVMGSRRSIVAQVAAGAAATLLLMVLVLSIALSSVIANSTQQDQLASLASRARVEGGNALAQGTSALKDARFVAADLQGYFRTAPDPLIELHAASSASGANVAAVSARLGELADLYPSEGLAYVVGSAQVITPPPPATATEGLGRVARQTLVTGLGCADSSGKSSVMVVGSALATVAVYPECLAAAGGSLSVGPGDTLLGVVVVTTPLDGGYLAARQRIDPSTSLSLVTSAGVLASAGPQPPTAQLRAAARRISASDRSSVSTTSGRELAATPLDAVAGTPVAVLVASTSDNSVVAVRARLERTLFFIALGGTVIALLFVAAIGERITSGLRRLTDVAVRIRRGGSSERADITSRDEVGALGAAFDSMVASIEAQTGALQSAAEDETRLRNRLQTVVAGMGDALVATDTEGRVTEFNAAAERLSGVAVGSAVGAPVRQVIDVVGAEGVVPGSGPLVGAASTRLAVLRRGDGVEVPVAVSVGVLRGPGGEAAGEVSVLRDLRREQEVERMKSEFLSRVGHELRTPLTAIMGYSEILMHRSATPAQSQAWHQEILGSAKRLARIVEMLEFVASSGAGRVLVHPEPHDVNTLVREVVAAWADRLGDRHSLTKRVARDTPAVLADRRWLGLAIDELMDNALKFSPNGGRIVLSAGPALDGAAVDITVGDRGMGMTAQEQALAFGEFVQGDASDTRRYGGLGLGLALVQRVVEGHGGSVRCESAPGAGSRLTLRLPAVPSEGTLASINGRGKDPTVARQRRGGGGS